MAPYPPPPPPPTPTTTIYRSYKDPVSSQGPRTHKYGTLPPPPHPHHHHHLQVIQGSSLQSGTPDTQVRPPPPPPPPTPTTIYRLYKDPVSSQGPRTHKYGTLPPPPSPPPPPPSTGHTRIQSPVRDPGHIKYGPLSFNHHHLQVF